MKKMEVRSLCDIHADEANQFVEADTYQGVLHGSILEVELCAEHAAATTVNQFQDVLSKYGVAVANMSSKGRPRYTAEEKARRKEEQQTCPECGQKFSERNGVRKHFKAAHPDKGFKCGQCGQTFTSNQGVVLHRRIVHEGFKPAATQVPSGEGTFSIAANAS